MFIYVNYYLHIDLNGYEFRKSLGIVSLGSREKNNKERLAKLKKRKEINFQCNEDHLGETDHFGEMFTRSTRKLYKSWRGIYKNSIVSLE